MALGLWGYERLEGGGLLVRSSQGKDFPEERTLPRLFEQEYTVVMKKSGEGMQEVGGFPKFWGALLGVLIL